MERPRILVGVTGSVASIKLPLLLECLLKLGEVRVVSTACAEHFWGNLTLPSDVAVFRDRDEWSRWQKMGDEVSCLSSVLFFPSEQRKLKVLHIELRRWATVFVIAPLDANTLAKLAHGLSDNLLTSVARCWDVRAVKTAFLILNSCDPLPRVGCFSLLL